MQIIITPEVDDDDKDNDDNEDDSDDTAVLSQPVTPIPSNKRKRKAPTPKQDEINHSIKCLNDEIDDLEKLKAHPFTKIDDIDKKNNNKTKTKRSIQSPIIKINKCNPSQSTLL